MTEEQVEKQAEKPLSLREELLNQINETVEVEEKEEVAVEEKPSEEEVTEEPAEENEEAEDTEEESEEEEDDTAEAVTETSDVPNNWNAEEKKAFEDIPDEIVTQDGTTISLKAMKSVALQRNEELLKAFNEKAREASTAKKGTKEWNNLLDPYKPQLDASGQTAQQWIGSILQTVHKLQADPKVVIKDLIGAYKVSASDLGYEQSDNEDDFHGESDPKVTKLETTIAGLHERLDSFENASVQQNNQSVQGEIATFKDATDADGNLTHPHFDEARVEMGILMQTGKAKSFQEAYDMSPAVKSKGLKSGDKKLALKKAREEAAKAKKAGKTIKTRSGPVGTYRKDISLRDELKEGLRATK